MLPAFVATYVGVDEPGFRSSSVQRRVGRAGLVGLCVTLGFSVVFAAMGLLISIGGNFVYRQFAGISITLGLILLALGVWLVGGRTIKTWTSPRLARAPTGFGLRAAVTYGAAYALISLGCTLPVFLVVVGSAFSSANVTRGLLLFVAYSAGMLRPEKLSQASG